MSPAAQGARAAHTIAGYLAMSAVARGQIVTTTQQLMACQIAPAPALATTNAAISQRQTIVTDLGALNVNGLPNGLTVQADLLQALDASVTADMSFAQWMINVENGSTNCGRYAQDASWQAATADSNAANATKVAFLQVWNPLATTYALPNYAEGQL